MKISAIKPQFVEFIPEQLSEGVLYISAKYKIALHLCCCGCRQEVVTPLSPAEWQVRKDGDVVSLSPSIGNWSFACRSHYWIERNRVRPAAAMSARQIEAVRQKDRRDKARHIDEINLAKQERRTPGPSHSPGQPWWRKVLAAIQQFLR